MFARLLAEAVPRTEDAFGAAGGGFHAPGPLKTHRVPQEAVHSRWSRLFCGPLKTHSVQQVLFCGPLKMRRVPEKAVFDTEYLFRTVEACFCAPNASENASRTPGSLFEHGTYIPYHRRAFPVPSAFEGVGKGPQETSSALAGRRKWWNGPERTR